MAKSFRDFVESIIYAGMKPGVTPSQSRRMRWLGPFREPLERFLNGGGSDDPFYLTNRTWGARLKLCMLLALPCVVVASVIALGGLGFIKKKEAPPAVLTGPQVAAKMLPDLSKPIDFNTETQVEVVEVSVTQDGRMLEGSVRNLSDRPVSQASMVFDLTDKHGSRLGAVNASVHDIGPKATGSFRVPLQQRGAAYALVREMHSE